MTATTADRLAEVSSAPATVEVTGDAAPESRRGTLARLRDGGRDAGMATAEYAIATVAAAGFAGLLILVLRSDEVRGLLTGIVRSALSL